MLLEASMARLIQYDTPGAGGQGAFPSILN